MRAVAAERSKWGTGSTDSGGCGISGCVFAITAAESGSPMASLPLTLCEDGRKFRVGGYYRDEQWSTLESLLVSERFLEGMAWLTAALHDSGAAELSCTQFRAMLSDAGADEGIATLADAAFLDALSIYDIDGSGVLEGRECLEYIGNLQANAARWRKAVTRPSFYTLSFSSGKPSLPFVPPSAGTMEITLQLTNDDRCTVATSLYVSWLTKAAGTVADSGFLFDALHVASYRFEEALQVYLLLRKDAVEKVDALKLLLPQMATPFDARRLLNVTAGESLTELNHLKIAIGHFHRAVIGAPNGMMAQSRSSAITGTVIYMICCVGCGCLKQQL
jgi:hypothetical protein